ncbi:MAG: DNA primase [Phycisphaerae bacterium]|nr:DNA primase [Phycisphaerae bacterium]
MMNSTDFRFGFRVLGDCRQPRRLVDAGAALAAYASCDERAELHREAYLSAFQFGGGFREHLERTGSTANFAGACWAPWPWWDVDRDGDLPAALNDARRLCVHVGDKLDVRDDDTLVFLSGSKGFHVGIPAALWAPDPGRDYHKVARRFAEIVAEQAGATIDAGVYDKVRCWRAPNSRHPRTALHKRRLPVDEQLHLRIDAILKLAEHPAPFELPAPSYRSEPTAALWTKAAEQVQAEADARAGRLVNGDTPARLNRATLDSIRDGAATGDRHRLLYSAAANLAELGAPLPLYVALLKESALDCGLSPRDVRRGIQCGWASVQPDAAEVCEAVSGEVVDVQPAPASAAPKATPAGKSEGGAE